MLVSWVIPLGIVLAFAALLVAPLVELLLSRMRYRRFPCPWANSMVSVAFVDRSAFGIVEPTDVHSCSAFPGPDRPTCNKACLGEFLAR